MKTIRKYISAFLLVSCMFVVVPNQAMDKFTTKIKDTIIANPYISASIAAGMLIGSCLYFKNYFFGESVTVEPTVKQDVKPNVKQDVLLQETLGNSTEAVKQEKDSSITQYIIAGNQPKRVIKVMNNQDQPLNICVSKDNDDSTQQFSVPSYSYDEIIVS